LSYVNNCLYNIAQYFCIQILENTKFNCIEKIKTIGYTYMAASGLTVDSSYADMSHVVALTEYAFAIKDQLRQVNEHSFNNFKMRIGEGRLNLENYVGFISRSRGQKIGF